MKWHDFIPKGYVVATGLLKNGDLVYCKKAKKFITVMGTELSQISNGWFIRKR